MTTSGTVLDSVGWLARVSHMFTHSLQDYQRAAQTGDPYAMEQARGMCRHLLDEMLDAVHASNVGLRQLESHSK